MKYTIFLPLLFLSSFSCTKEKDCLPLPDYSPFEGTWQVEDSFTALRNDSIIPYWTYEYQYVFQADGSGQEIRDNYTVDVQLGLNPVQQTISVVQILLPDSPDRQLVSDNYDIVEMSPDFMLWEDVSVQGPPFEQTSITQLKLTRIK